MKLTTALTLGRVSNLPTVWTNTLLGMTLAGFTGDLILASLALLAFSLFYLGGMFFNDAFDAQWDRLHQQRRPIVTGETTVKEVAIFASVFFLAAMCILVLIAPENQRFLVFLSALALVSCILLYDWKHKAWSYSAWIMGACRFWVYITAALLIGAINWLLLLAGLCLMAYIAGITYLARSEHLNRVNSFWPLLLLALPMVFALIYTLVLSTIQWPALLAIAVTSAWIGYGIKFLLPGENRFIPRAIGVLLAGLCLIDGSLLCAAQHYYLAGFAFFAFGLCLLLQIKIKAS